MVWDAHCSEPLRDLLVHLLRAADVHHLRLLGTDVLLSRTAPDALAESAASKGPVRNGLPHPDADLHPRALSLAHELQLVGHGQVAQTLHANEELERMAQKGGLGAALFDGRTE